MGVGSAPHSPVTLPQLVAGRGRGCPGRVGGGRGRGGQGRTVQLRDGLSFTVTGAGAKVVSGGPPLLRREVGLGGGGRGGQGVGVDLVQALRL